MGEVESWMTQDLEQVPGVQRVLVVSADGLVMTTSGGMSRDEADTMAAACSSLFSVGGSVAGLVVEGERPRQVFVEFPGGFVIVQEGGPLTRLAVIAGPDVAPGLIGQEMARTAARLGQAMATTAREDQPT